MASPPITAERPLRSDAQRNRVRVLAAAADAFSELGLDARMEDIARRAGVGVGTVYRHFPTKEALMGELLAERWRTLGEQAREALETEPDPWEAFAGALRRNAETMATDAAVRDDIMRLENPEVIERAADAKAGLMAATAELIARGKTAGVLREDLDVDDVPLMMCGVCATMGVSGPKGPLDWRRHLELALDGARRR